MSIGPPHPGLGQVRCSCCKALTNRSCAARSSSDFIRPPSYPLSSISREGWTTLVHLRASNRIFYASTLLLSEGGLNLPSLRASNEHFPNVRVLRTRRMVRLPSTLPTHH